MEIVLDFMYSSISKELIYSCGKFVWNVSKNKEILDFKCNQFEADTIMFSIYYDIRSTDADTMVVIDTTDTDCYVQAAAVSKKIQGPLALRRKGQLISSTKSGRNHSAISQYDWV